MRCGNAHQCVVLCREESVSERPFSQSRAVSDNGTANVNARSKFSNMLYSNSDIIQNGSIGEGTVYYYSNCSYSGSSSLSCTEVVNNYPYSYEIIVNGCSEVTSGGLAGDWTQTCTVTKKCVQNI